MWRVGHTHMEGAVLMDPLMVPPLMLPLVPPMWCHLALGHAAHYSLELVDRLPHMPHMMIALTWRLARTAQCGAVPTWHTAHTLCLWMCHVARMYTAHLSAYVPNALEPQWSPVECPAPRCTTNLGQTRCEYPATSCIGRCQQPSGGMQHRQAAG